MSAAMEYQLQAIWSIKKETFTSLDEDDEIYSKKFKTTLPGIEYYLVMQGGDPYTAIWIDTNDDVSIKEMKLIITSANFEADLTVPVFDRVRYEEYENTVLIKNKDLLNAEKKYFVNDILKIEFHGILCYKAKKLDIGRLLWKDDENKDFTFIVGNEKIKIHKILIRQYSSFFAKNMDKNEVNIEDFDKNAVKLVVSLCYGQTNWYGLPDDDLLSAIKFTNIYEMPIIKAQAELQLKKYINVKNAHDLANKSIELKADQLRAFCVNFISNLNKSGGTIDRFADLKAEIVREVFKNTICHTDTT